MRHAFVLFFVAACGPSVTTGSPGTGGGGDLAMPATVDAAMNVVDLATVQAKDLAVPQHDLARPPPDLTPPPPKVTVVCGGMTCSGATSSCCISLLGAPPRCIVPGGSCSAGTEYACDGADDCKSTEECCLSPSGSQCQAVGNCGTRLCQTMADCRLGDRCCPANNVNPYPYCAQLCQ